MPEDEARTVAENLLEALRFFGQARSDAEIRDLPGISLIFCGLNYAAFNAALQARPIQGDAQELSNLINVSAEQFDARSLRWTYWLCEDFLSQPLRPVADEATLNAFSEVMSTAFEIPHAVSLSVYGSARAWKGSFEGYVGYSNG